MEVFSPVFAADGKLVGLACVVDGVVEGGSHGLADEAPKNHAKSQGANTVVGLGKWDDASGGQVVDDVGWYFGKCDVCE